jgi:hypothetical protein
MKSHDFFPFVPAGLFDIVAASDQSALPAAAAETIPASPTPTEASVEVEPTVDLPSPSPAPEEGYGFTLNPEELLMRIYFGRVSTDKK